jgi:hypothetical protein
MAGVLLKQPRSQGDEQLTVGSVPQGNQARNGCCRLDYFFKKANQAFGMKRYCPALRLRFDDLQRRDACGIFVAAFGVILRPQERSHATARLHHSARRRGGVAARGTRAATGDAGGRVSQQRIA